MFYRTHLVWRSISAPLPPAFYFLLFTFYFLLFTFYIEWNTALSETLLPPARYFKNHIADLKTTIRLQDFFSGLNLQVGKVVARTFRSR